MLSEIDFTKIYLYPMSRECNADTVEELTKCSLKLLNKKDGTTLVTAIEPGFRTKMFYDEHIKWLIYTKRITIVE